MKNKARGFFALLMLAGCGLMANALGQNYPPNIGPVTFSLNGSSGTYVLSPSLNGQSYCTVTVPSTATMGSGTITLKTSGDNGANWFAVTGLPDLGSGASASQRITVAGTQLTAPVSGKTGFELVLSGATGAAITGSIACGNGSGATGSNSGSGPIPTPSSGIYPVSVVAPTYSAEVQVNFGGTAQPVTVPTPTGNVAVFPGATIPVTTPVPNATAISPAPAGILAHGYNAAGAAAPIICTQHATVILAATTQATETLMVPSASGKTIYVCSVLISGQASLAGGIMGLGSSATNTCGSMTTIYAIVTSAQPEYATGGAGVGVVTLAPSGAALCFFNPTVSAADQSTATIMYEQF